MEIITIKLSIWIKWLMMISLSDGIMLNHFNSRIKW
jgi:hypothetical protein